MESQTGLIADIQRCSLQDGPGIRTTVFVKGCPLQCRWCHNPEMINPCNEVWCNEVWYNAVRCTSCGECIEVCSVSAIKGYKEEREIDRDACTSCMECVEVCPNHAMSAVGREITIEDALKEIQKDVAFYRHDGGGATISGGELALQSNFTTELLKECQTHLIHTTLDTCGYVNWDTLSQIAKHADLILFDIKHMDPVRHKLETGVSNKLILGNVKRLASVADVRIRVPVIPGFNDSEDEFREIAEFMVSNNLNHIDLLPYHAYAEGKYKRLGKKYEFAGTQSPTEEHMQNLKTMFESYGLEVTIGGET